MTLSVTRAPHVLLGLAALLLATAAAPAQDAGSWSDVFAYPGARLAQPGDGDNSAAATVYAVEPDGRGGYYVGGQFTSIDGVAVSSIAHWDGQAWSPLGDGVRYSSGYGQIATVYDLQLAQDGSLYVVGDFDSVLRRNGRAVTARGIARWTNAGWEPVGGGLGTAYGLGAVRGLAEGPDGAIYASGIFENAVNPDGIAIPARSVARWKDGGWSDPGVSTYSGASVEALAVAPDGRIAVVGVLEDAGPFAYTQAVFVIQPDGTREGILGWGGVTTLAWSGRSLFVGGAFATYGDVELRYVGRWIDGVWDDLEGGMDETVLDLVSDGVGGVYAAGRFTTAGLSSSSPARALGVAHWTPSGWSGSGGVASESTAWERPNVWAVAPSGDAVVIVGSFEGVQNADGQTSNAAAIAIRRGTEWSPLSAYRGDRSLGRRPSTNGYLRPAVLASALSPCGSGVLIGGSLPTVGGATAANVALWDGRAWQPIPGQMSSAYYYGYAAEVTALVPVGCAGGRPQFYATGSFTQIALEDGTVVAASGVAFWDGRTWSALEGTMPEGGVRAAAWDQGTLYVAGTLSQPQGGTYSAFGIYGWQAGRGWEPVGGGLDGEVAALAIGPDGALYVGGSFGSVRQTNGLPVGVGGLARWNGQAWEWIGNPTSNQVRALTFDRDGRLYVAGPFESFVQPSRPVATTRNVAVWDGAEWSDYGPLSGEVATLAVGAGGRLYAGLRFDYSYYDRPPDRLWVSDTDGWRPLGVTVGSVYALALDGNDLYVGGTFTSAGPTPSAFLALYTDPRATPSSTRPPATALALEVAPNPVQSRARIALEVAEAGPVRVGVYDALGREVAVLWDGPAAAGSLPLDLEAGGLPAGTYVARVQAGGIATARVFTVVR